MPLHVASAEYRRDVRSVEQRTGALVPAEIVSANSRLSLTASEGAFHPGDALWISILNEAKPEVFYLNRERGRLTRARVEARGPKKQWRARIELVDLPTEIICTSFDDEISVVLSCMGCTDDLAPRRQQGPYKRKRVLGYVLLCLTALTILNWSLYAETLDQLAKRFAVVLTAVATALGVFGIRASNRTLFPFRWLLASEKSADVATALGALIVVGLTLNAIPPLSCIWRAYLYDQHLEDALIASEVPRRVESAKRAMAVFPERLEPYLLLAKGLDELRYSDRRLLRQLSIELTGPSSDVRDTIARFLNAEGPCECTDFGSAYLNSHRRRVMGWFMLREAEATGYPSAAMPDGFWVASHLPQDLKRGAAFQLREAVWEHEALSYARAREAHIGRPSTTFAAPDYPQAMGEILARVSTLRRNLYGILWGPDDYAGLRAEEPNTYEVQLSLDTQFQHHLLLCEFKEAGEFMSEILLQRQRSRDTETLWLDGPEKLTALRFVRSVRASEALMKTHLYLPAYDLRASYSQCPNSEDGVSSIWRDLESDFPEWLKPDEKQWRLGTVEGLTWGDLSKIARSRSKLDWRY